MSDVAAIVGSVGIALFGGAIRMSTPFVFVSVGECITERSGRINLGLEGTLIFGGMAAFGASLWSSTYFPLWLCPWVGVLAAACCGATLGAVHAFLCQQKRVNDIAIGIAMMLFGIGLAFFLGKNLIPQSAPRLQELNIGNWSSSPAVRSALSVNYLFFVGILLALAVQWGFRNTRWGMILRTVGESVDAARAMGYSVNGVRMTATMTGGALAGIGGSFLTLYYPGGWSEGLSQGQGLMAVALVIFARWKPIYCVYASLLFGAMQALAPALQAAGITWGRHLFLAMPYLLTLVVMIITCSPKRSQVGAPAELGKIRTA